MCAPVCQMIFWWVVLGLAVHKVLPLSQNTRNWSCALQHLSKLSCISIGLRRRVTIVLLRFPVAVELSTWIGNFSWGQPISSSRFWSDIISWVVVNSAESLASAADAITVLMTRAMQRMGPLGLGIRSLSKTKMFALTQLLDFDSLR